MRTRCCRVLVLVLAAALADSALLAQQTWLVAPSGGQFTNLQTAVDFAAPGDTLIVRGGSHGNVWIDHSLSIVGDQPRPTLGRLTVYGGASVSVHGLLVNNSVTLLSCFASLEAVEALNLDVRASHAVFTGCTLGLADIFGTYQRTVTDLSHVVFDHCELHGSRGFVQVSPVCVPLPGGPALTVENGALVEIANSNLVGAPATIFGCLNSLGTSGLHADAGTSVRLGRSTVTAAAGVGAVSGTGAVTYENTTFTPSYAGGTPAIVPVVTGSGAALGGTMDFELRSAPGLSAALLASLGQRAPTPVPAGMAWIDLNASVLLGLGLLDASGAMALAIDIPISAPRGLPLTIQGVVAATPGAPLLASSPTILHVR